MLLDGSKYIEGSTIVNFVLPVMSASERLKLTMKDPGELVYQRDDVPDYENGLYLWTLSNGWQRFGSGTFDISKMLSGTLPPALNTPIIGDVNSSVDSNHGALRITLNDHIIPDADLGADGLAAYNYVTVNSKGQVTSGAYYSDITKLGITNIYTKLEIEDKLSKLVLTDLKNIDGGYIGCVNGEIDPTVRPKYEGGDVITTTDRLSLTLVDRGLNDTNSYSRFRVNRKGLIISADNYNTIAEVAPDAVTMNYITDLKSQIVYLSERNMPNGYVSLNADMKINEAFMPSIKINDIVVTDTIASLTNSAARIGDIAVITDTNSTYIRKTLSGNISDWVELITPTKVVTSINNKTGTIVKLDYDDINGLALSARIDTTNAGNLSTGTLSTARLPELAGDVTSLVGTNITTLASRNIVDDTYNQVHVDHKGLVVDAFKRTSILDLGITDVNTKFEITEKLRNYESFVNKNMPNGYVGLDITGKIPPLLLPPLRVSAVHNVNTLADLGLLVDTAVGDIAIVTSESTTYVLASADPTNVNNWKELLTPASGVYSINGRQGPIVLQASDVAGLAKSATTDTTNANNITDGLLSPVLLPSFVGDVTSTGSTNRLELADKFAATPTDKFSWVRVDKKGRVVDGGKYTTIKEVCTDAVTTLDLANSLGSYVNAGYYNVPGTYVRLGDNGKIDNNLIPDLAITNVFVVDDPLDSYEGYVAGMDGTDILQSATIKKAAQKTLPNPTGHDYGTKLPEQGDVIVLTNVSRSYIVMGTPVIAANLTELMTPLDGVFTIGTGTDLQKGHISKLKVNNFEFNSSVKFRNVDSTLKQYNGIAPSAVIDATHANNIDTGTLDFARLPEFKSSNVVKDKLGTTIPSTLVSSDVDSYSADYPNILVLNNVPSLSGIITTKTDPNNLGGLIPETYTKVSINKKGQIVDASNPTTLEGYSITDAIWASQIHNTTVARLSNGPNAGKAVDANGVVLGTYLQDVLSSDGTKYSVEKIISADINKVVTLKKGVAELDANNYIMLDQIPFSVGSHVHWLDILERPLGNAVDYDVASKVTIKSSPSDPIVEGLPYADAGSSGITTNYKPEVVIGTDYRLTNNRFPEAHSFHTLLDVSNGLTGTSKRTLNLLLNGDMITDPLNPGTMIHNGEGKADKSEVKDIITALIGEYSYLDMNVSDGTMTKVNPKNNYDTLATLYGWIMGKNKEVVVDVFDKTLPVTQNGTPLADKSAITDVQTTVFDPSITTPFTLFVKHNDGVLNDNMWAMYRVFTLDSNRKISNLNFISKVSDNNLYTALSDQTFTDKYNDLTGWNVQSTRTKLALNPVEPALYESDGVTPHIVTDGEWYRYYISTLAPNKTPVFEIKATAPYFNSTASSITPPFQIASKKKVSNLNIELVNNTYFPEVQTSGKTIVTKNPVSMPAVPAHTDIYGRAVAEQPAYTRYEVEWINSLNVGAGLTDIYEFPYVSGNNALSTANSVMKYVPGIQGAVAQTSTLPEVQIKKATIYDLTLVGYKETIKTSTDTAKLFDSTNGSVVKVTANSSSIAIQYPTGFTLADGAGKTCTLIIKYTQSSNFITWPTSPSVIWTDGNIPPIASGANSTDIFNFICDGEYVYGCISGQNYKTAAFAANSSPVGSVQISGSLTANSVLTAANTITDVNGIAPSAITYDWYFKGAADSVYNLVKSNSITNTTAVPGSMYVIAKYVDNNGYIENVTSPVITIA